jgi:carbamoyl-phosphate synthase large subunit
MDNFKIAISGVGGGVGQSVIKSLYNTGYSLVGLDGEALGTGLYAVPSSYIIPYANSSDFLPEVLEICRREKISLFFPGLDAELKPLSAHREAFKAIGTNVVVSEPRIIDISDNKLLTYQELTKSGINVPFTQGLDASTNPGFFPLIIKQKIGGARSKNVFFIKNRTVYDNVIRQIGDHAAEYIMQEYIDGEEYTCGSINLNGECKGVIVMRRILRDGDTYKCFSVRHPVIEETVKNIMNAIRPFGACNVQLRLKDGVPFVFEINARCSGTTASRTLCGFNEPKLISDFLLKGISPSFKIEERTILRYLKELVIDNNHIELMDKQRLLHLDKPENL